MPVVHEAEKGAVLVVHDITSLRRADQIRRDFVANVSHELRTPLTAIAGYVEALRDQTPEAAEQQRFLDIIARHTLRMERLVSDLLRLARLEAGQEIIEPRTASIESIFHEVLADFGDRVTARQQRLTIMVDPAAGSITTDTAKLGDALRNLVDNALKYAPEHSEVELTATPRNTRVLLTVGDWGREFRRAT